MKKDFSQNPALQMLSSYTEKENEKAEPIKTQDNSTEKENTVEKSKVRKASSKTFKPIKKENKSKKLLLLLTPSLFEKLQTKAQSYNLSTNEFINQILESNV